MPSSMLLTQYAVSFPLHPLLTGCLSTVYVLILEQLLEPKTLFFYFCGLVQNPAFQIIHKHPVSRSFLDRHLILYGWTSHIVKYLRL